MPVPTVDTRTHRWTVDLGGGVERDDEFTEEPPKPFVDGTPDTASWSVGVVTVAMPSLAPGESITAPAGGSVTRRLPDGPGAGRVRATPVSGGAGATVAVAAGYVPSTDNNDAVADLTNGPAVLTVPAGDDRSVTVTASADAPATVAVAFDTPTPGIDAVAPEQAGVGGRATFTLSGGGLDVEGTTAELVAGVDSRPAVRYAATDPLTAYVTFDLDGLDPGPAQIRVAATGRVPADFRRRARPAGDRRPRHPPRRTRGGQAVRAERDDPDLHEPVDERRPVARGPDRVHDRWPSRLPVPVTELRRQPHADPAGRGARAGDDPARRHRARHDPLHADCRRRGRSRGARDLVRRPEPARPRARLGHDLVAPATRRSERRRLGRTCRGRARSLRRDLRRSVRRVPHQPDRRARRQADTRRRVRRRPLAVLTADRRRPARAHPRRMPARRPAGCVCRPPRRSPPAPMATASRPFARWWCRTPISTCPVPKPKATRSKSCSARRTTSVVRAAARSTASTAVRQNATRSPRASTTCSRNPTATISSSW